MFDAIMELYRQQAPFAVMIRATLEHLISSERLDVFFDEEAVGQYFKKITFSSITDLMLTVVLDVYPSVNRAYLSDPAVFNASQRAVYDKIARVSPLTGAALVELVAGDAAQVIAAMPNAFKPEPVPGLRMRILDGNYLAGTEHRLKETREVGGAVLPGMSVVMRDHRTGLIVHSILCEDGHSNERAHFGTVSQWFKAKDLAVCDRNFCTEDLLQAIVDKKAYFVIRLHGSAPFKQKTKFKPAGETETGVLSECRATVGGVKCRCIRIKLHQPTRDGETELYILTNLTKAQAGAALVAKIYSERWDVEKAFLHLTEALRCEVNTLAYPKAALFGFAMAVVAYNLFMVIEAALASAHGREKVENDLSFFAVADEVAGINRGMEVVLPDPKWAPFSTMSLTEFAHWLIVTVRDIDWTKYTKAKRGPKKPVKKEPAPRGGHTSTAKLLKIRARK